jgi:hypothetical protein
MTATDFLERRADAVEPGPATWGWRGRVRRWSGGTITPRMGPAERAYEQDRALIQKDFDGPVTIAFINPKGGAAKTTGVLAAGYTFGTVRGGGVVAWDNNETRGTLGIRGSRSTHTKTTKELLATSASSPTSPSPGSATSGRTSAPRGTRTSTCSPPTRAPTSPARSTPTTSTPSPAAHAVLQGHPRRHRKQHAGRELAGRGRRRRPARGHLDGA